MKQVSVLTTSSLFTTPDHVSEAKASTSDMNLDNDRMHLSPSNKHAGHKLVVKAYNGPSLAHQQN